MRHFVSLVIYLSLLFPYGLNAAAQYVSCESCASNYDFSVSAERAAKIKGNQKSEFYTYNLESKKIFAYEVYIEYEPGGYALASAIPKQVPTPVNTEFQKVAKSYEDVKNGLKGGVAVPTSIATSAYQLASKSYIKNDVKDYINEQNSALIDKIENFFTGIAEMTGVVDYDFWKFETYYSDGSKAILIITSITSGLGLELELESAIDADNNDIPLTPEDVKIGEYRFEKGGQAAFNEFTNLARALGINIGSANYSGGSSGAGGSYKLSCNQSGSNCTITYSPY